jgi:hypothetical protein
MLDPALQHVFSPAATCNMISAEAFVPQSGSIRAQTTLPLDRSGG